ncbi:hypothetical protein STVA_12580 [Allostella vacuolata]|nr:hypothetical protein STVA_12580 [Stella vacuolata]
MPAAVIETFSASQVMSVLEAIACAAFAVDVLDDGTFRFIGLNATHTASSGVRSDSIAGRRPHDVLPQAAADAVCANYRRCVEARGPVRYEERLVLADQARWWSTTLMPHFGPDGRVTRIIGTAFDITAQKDMEAELRRSGAFLQTVIDHVPFPIFCKDAADLRYAFVNRAMEAYVGVPTAGVVGRTDYDLHPAEQAARFQASDHAVLASGQPVTVEMERLHSAAGERILRTRKLVIPDDAGQPRWVLGVSEDETDRRLAEAAADAARDLLQAAIDHMPIMVVCKDAAELRYTLINRAGEYYFGRPRDEVVGRRASEIFPSAWAGEFDARDRAVLAGGGPVTVTEVIETPDGPRRVRSTKIAIPAPDGTPRHLLGITEDLTESHRLEARLHDAIGSIQDGFILFDKDDRIVLHNARFVEFYPFLRDKLPLEGRTFEDSVHDGTAWRRTVMSEEEERRYVEQRLRRWRNGPPGPFERQLPDGRWVLISEHPTADGGVVGIHTDITAQKQAEIRLVDAIESIDQGFILCDADDRVILSNRRIREMFPTVAPHIVPGASMRDLVLLSARSGDYGHDFQTAEEAADAMFRLYRSGTTEGLERQLRDGRWILFNQTVTPNGLRVGLRTDISLQKARQRQLGDIRDHLQKQAAELMRMTNDLHVARHRAEEASRAKSQFLAMISHELRTPFTGIRGMADLLAETALGPDQERYLDVMRRSLERLLTLLDQLLDFSRIEAGHVEIVEMPMAPARLVADALTTFAAGAEAKGVRLEQHIDATVPAEVIGDPAKTSQVLSNLVGNAVKFTEHGRVLISLAVEDQGAARFLCWTVEDTGIGLSAEEMTRLFEPFTQADASTSRRFGGTGLGLAISKRLAEAMGGSIGVSSMPGRGARFWFRTPMRPVAQPVEPSPDTTPEALVAAPTGVRCRILVAEDDPINQMLIETMLSRWGFDTAVVDDGQAALDRLAATQREGVPFDIVLMDVNMPRMDGPTAVARMRAEGGPVADMPVFALTADVLPEHVAAYRRAGFTDVLTKPIDWTRLRGLLEAPRGR